MAMGSQAKRAGLLFVALAAASGCASAQLEARKEPFPPFLFAPQPEPPAPRRANLHKPPGAGGTDGGAVPRFRLDAALMRFGALEREARTSTSRGGTMPAPLSKAWTDLVGQVDRFLRQRPQETVPLDVVRARVTLEAELQMDADWYLRLPAGLEASVLARIAGLDRRLGEIRRLPRPAEPPPSDFLWPTDPVLVTSLFGMRLDPFTHSYRQHLGVDLQADEGQLVQAAAPGVVVRAGWTGGHGRHVEVAHDDGSVTRYSHLSLVLVSPGMRVPARGPVGLAGSTGRSTGPHVHFEVWRDGQPLDPLEELGDPSILEIRAGAIGIGE